jgi:hypothetical protein
MASTHILYTTPVTVPEDDIVIVTPGHRKKAKNPNEPSGESVDDDDSINIGHDVDEDDDHKMPKLIPQTINDDSDCDSNIEEEDDDDDDTDSEADKGPITGITSSRWSIRVSIRYR